MLLKIANVIKMNKIDPFQICGSNLLTHSHNTIGLWLDTQLMHCVRLIFIDVRCYMLLCVCVCAFEETVFVECMPTKACFEYKIHCIRLNARISKHYFIIQSARLYLPSRNGINTISWIVSHTWVTKWYEVFLIFSLQQAKRKHRTKLFW